MPSGFQKGHKISPETRAKISIANKGIWVSYHCDYCGKAATKKQSHFRRTKRHFCSRNCYSRYREELLPREEQPSYGTGFPLDERKRRANARIIFNHYMRDNHLARKPCEICGENAEAHHDDYGQPLKVRWLCFRHHREWHKLHNNPELLEGGNND